MAPKILYQGKILEAEEGALLSTVLSGEKPCGGHGKCGKCKVIAHGALSPLSESEHRLLSTAEQARGVRLACCTRIIGDCEVLRLDEDQSHPEHARILDEGQEISVALHPSFLHYGASIDIGTTTLAARLYDTKGRLLASASTLNPQSTWGADVVSRIEASLNGATEALADAIRKAIDSLLEALSQKANIPTREIDGVVLTGNTVMLYLLTSSSPHALSRAPFKADRLFGEMLTAKKLSLHTLSPDTVVYLPPCISAFVGADMVCAILAARLCDSSTPRMLADIGTNGEMALWHENHLTVCSTAAGPAFEGVGISMGMRAADGAVDKVFTVNGSLYTHVVGNDTPRGICGSGLVDAIAALLDMEVLDEGGYLESDPFPLAPPVTLTGKDVRMVQLAKSAICAGLETLLQSASLSPERVDTLHVAGGFGSYLDPRSAKRIGLLPSALADRFETVGNAALSGASMLLLNDQLRTEAQWIAENASLLELSTSPVFSEHYMMGMLFPEI